MPPDTLRRWAFDDVDGLFADVETAHVVVEPEQAGPGSWAGCAERRGRRRGGLPGLPPPETRRAGPRLRQRGGPLRGRRALLDRRVLHRDAFGGDSLERPCLVRTPDRRWRLYVSVASPGSKHWRVDLLEADEPAGLVTADAVTVLPGDNGLAVKDPVVRLVDGTWHAWASRHPLDDPDATDRMTTDHATSLDGRGWVWDGTALAGRPAAAGPGGTRALQLDPPLVRGPQDRGRRGAGLPARGAPGLSGGWAPFWRYLGLR